jgi:outer membrane protein TolC
MYREINRELALLQNQLIPKAKQSLEIARTGYLSGTIDFFNLIDAERTLLNFGLAEIEARTRREIVLAEMSLMIAGVPPEGAPVLSVSNPTLAP